MNAVQHAIIFAVRVYQRVLSPAKVFLVGPSGHCRFDPTCSEYALQAVARHGALRGSWLALKRIARCHPWGGCGADPVPPVPVQPPPRLRFGSASPRLPRLETPAKSAPGLGGPA